MEIETITQLINSFGFPIFIALYFIFRMEKIIKENTLIISQCIALQTETRLVLEQERNYHKMKGG